MKSVSKNTKLTLDYIARMRSVVNAGLYLTITQRCPMSCSHCSTNSSISSPLTPDKDELLNFILSMNEHEHPEIILLTGGEPFIYPDLITQITAIAKKIGCKVQAITGGFWLKKPSKLIINAIQNLDLLTFSFDKFHEASVSVPDLFAGIDLVHSLDVPVAIQTVEDKPGSEFTCNFLSDIGKRYKGLVEVHVAPLAPVGRASSNSLTPLKNKEVLEHPCIKAAWPVLSYTGNIVSCCSQVVIDNPEPPAHLLLGKLGMVSYPEVASIHRDRLALRAVRTCGPAIFKNFNAHADSYCSPCLTFNSDTNTNLKELFHEKNGESIEKLLSLSILHNKETVIRPGSNDSAA